MFCKSKKKDARAFFNKFPPDIEICKMLTVELTCANPWAYTSGCKKEIIIFSSDHVHTIEVMSK